MTSTVIPTLADPALQEAFERDGEVVLPLVGPERLTELRALVEPYIPAEAGPFVSVYRNDIQELRRELSTKIIAALQADLDRVLQSQRLYMANLFVKRSGEGSYLDLHQDWSFVPNQQCVSGAVWLPLEGTDASNGALHVVVGSHRLGLSLTGLTPANPVEPVRGDLEAGYLTRLDLTAGQAIVYDHRLIHGSGENHSGRDRIAIVVAFVPRDVHLCHYIVDQAGNKKRYTVTDDFFFDYQPGMPPEGPAVLQVEDVADVDVSLTPADLHQLVKTSG